jgi:hypothetical protein
MNSISKWFEELLERKASSALANYIGARRQQ